MMGDGGTDARMRFGGIERLWGKAGLERLERAHVAVVGLGGVGSWAAEALARSGVGALTLVDLDDVCVTNINRQVQALEDTVGRPKVEAMRERILRIHPDCRVTAQAEFFRAETAEGLWSRGLDYVVDAIDDVTNKCLLVAEGRGRGVPVVVCGGAGGKRDGTAVRMEDLARTTHDRLLQKVRERLRREHGFPRGEGRFGVMAVYSTEAPVFLGEDGTVCAEQPARGDFRMSCERGFGTAAFVTAAFGMAAAGWVVRELARAR